MNNKKKAEALLVWFKAREEYLFKNLSRKIVWRDQQPTLVEGVINNTEKWFSYGVPTLQGRPACNDLDRIPSQWEAMRDERDRRPFSVSDTPIMRFSGSSPLPSHYYAENVELESYIETLKNN